jgi:hypothetical protein
MSKFSLDYDNLEQKVYKKAYKLSDVKNKIERVAFDVVRFSDGDDASKLWQVQSADDGDYIVALYDEPEESQKTASSNWEVVLNKASSMIDVYYKGDPIVRVAASKLGIPSDELALVSKYLPKKLTENKKLATALLSEAGDNVRQELYKKYPELA